MALSGCELAAGIVGTVGTVGAGVMTARLCGRATGEGTTPLYIRMPSTASAKMKSRMRMVMVQAPIYHSPAFANGLLPARVSGNQGVRV